MRFRLSRPFAGLLPAPAFCLAACLASVPVSAQPALSLDVAVGAATVRSGLVAAAASDIQAARDTAAGAARLPDPVLRMGLDNLPVTGSDRFNVSKDFMTMRSVGVMQELTRGDKRKARLSQAERQVEAAEIGRRATVAELQRDAALAWLERSFLDSTKALIEAQIVQALLQAEAAETLYRNGKGALADVFAMRGQVEQWRDKLEQTERQIAVATTALARWIGADAVRPLAARPAFALPAWTQGELADHLDGHPQIAAAAQQVALADADAALASAARSTDWSVELMYSQRGPAYSNMVSVNVSVPLQWDRKNRQDRDLAARLAAAEAARSRYADVQRLHEADVRAMLHEWQSHERRLVRYDTALLPLAGQRSSAALASYRAGTGVLPAVIDARSSELEVQLERLRLERERARVWARLNFLLPTPDSAAGAAHTSGARP